MEGGVPFCGGSAVFLLPIPPSSGAEGAQAMPHSIHHGLSVLRRLLSFVLDVGIAIGQLLRSLDLWIKGCVKSRAFLLRRRASARVSPLRLSTRPRVNVPFYPKIPPAQ